MRVLFLLDEVFSTRERPLIERLEVGLADEGVRVVRAVPDTLQDAPPGGFFVETASYTREGLILTRKGRARRLLDAVAPGPDKPIDVIHAMGGGAWTMAATIARLRSCPVALEVWRTGLGARAKSIRAALAPDIPVWLLCPDQGTMDDLAAAGLGEATRLTPWGVHATDEPRTLLTGDVAASIVVVGSGRDSRALAAAMEGLARALPSTDDARVYIDADAAHRARLWGVLEKLSLTERASLIPAIEARRELALLSDVLVVPESLGEHRTIVLDAMGAGMAVLAAADPRVSWLIGGTTARLVGTAEAPGTAEHWAAAIRETVLSPERARALGASARAHVLEHFKASGHVAGVMSAYAAMTSTGTAGSIGI
jgi:hypothetical protein